MELEDQIIKYRNQISNINNIIESLESLGIDSTWIKSETTELLQQLNSHLNQITDKYFLIKEYEEATTKLWNLETEIIRKYDKYLKIFTSYQWLQEHISEINESNIFQYTEEIKNMLTNLEILQQTTNITINKINDIYEATYRFMLLELIYTNKTSLINVIYPNSIAASYIEKYILEDINATDLTLNKNTSLKNELKRVEKQDTPNYIDCNLLRQIIESKYDTPSLQTTIPKSPKKKIKKLTIKKEKLEKRIKKLRNERNHQLKKTLRIVGYLTTVFTIAPISIVVCAKVVQKHSGKKYETIERVYTGRNSNIKKQTYYEKELQDTVILEHPSDWHISKDDPNLFERTMYYYDLSDLPAEDIIEYYNLFFSSYYGTSQMQSIPTTEIPETKDRLSVQDLNQEPNTYTITQKIHNPNNSLPNDAFLFPIIIGYLISITNIEKENKSLQKLKNAFYNLQNSQVQLKILKNDYDQIIQKLETLKYDQNTILSKSNENYKKNTISSSPLVKTRTKNIRKNFKEY